MPCTSDFLAGFVQTYLTPANVSKQIPQNNLPRIFTLYYTSISRVRYVEFMVNVTRWYKKPDIEFFCGVVRDKTPCFGLIQHPGMC